MRSLQDEHLLVCVLVNRLIEPDGGGGIMQCHLFPHASES